VHSAVEMMLAAYRCTTPDDYKNALKEIIQEIALLALFRGGFFDHAAFYGGTALRIFHALPRFSEDLDFSLLKKDTAFDISRYGAVIREEMAAYGFDVDVMKKEKKTGSAIESAFIKCGMLTHFLKIEAISPPVAGVHAGELLKIKIEVDTDPPPGAGYEVKYLLAPVPFAVRLFDQGSLFAGKVHAVMCREWNSGRIKGRDLYDYVWYLSKKIPLNIRHLEQRMRQTGHRVPAAGLTLETVIAALEQKFHTIDYVQAKQDILPFINNPAELAAWSAAFFVSITNDRLLVQKAG
jgi:predicted nucleotidyltransferase component of viral defense system